MWCPKCAIKLIEIDYKGIKVDRCSECEGMYGLTPESLKGYQSLKNKGLIYCSTCLRSDIIVVEG